MRGGKKENCFRISIQAIRSREKEREAEGEEGGEEKV